jgi:hypothetical protein
MSYLLKRAAHQDQGQNQDFMPRGLADPLIGLLIKEMLSIKHNRKKLGSVQDKSPIVIVSLGGQGEKITDEVFAGQSHVFRAE